MSKSSVLKIKKECLPDGKGGQAGHPHKLTPQDKQFCVPAMTLGKLETALQVTKWPSEGLGINVSDKTFAAPFTKQA